MVLGWRRGRKQRWGFGAGSEVPAVGASQLLSSAPGPLGHHEPSWSEFQKHMTFTQGFCFEKENDRVSI